MQSCVFFLSLIMPRQPRTPKRKSQNLSTEEEVIEAVCYAKGFIPPKPKKIKSAIGYGDADIPIEFNPGEPCHDGFEFFKHIPKPTNIDDWLAQYNEEGQTYGQFLEQCPWLSTRKRKYMSQKFTPTGQTLKQKYPNGKIYIVPVGTFDHEGTHFYSSLLEYTSIFLGLPVVSLPEVKLEIDEGKVFWVEEPTTVNTNRRTSKRTRKCQLTSRYNRTSKQLQVRIDSNLMQLRQKIPPDALCMIGLTMLDLYGDETDLFVAGMAAGNERVAIFSLYRYDPCLSFSTEHWFEVIKDKKMSEKNRLRIILQRSCKLLVHEICHLLGIDHCIFFDCCMNGSGHLAEDFRQPMQLCPVDLRKLFTLVGFDITERYKSLQQFFQREGFKEEQDWVIKRLEFLNS